MEQLLTKYFWVLNLTTLCIVALLLASGTGELIASSISEKIPKAEVKQRTRPPRQRPSPSWERPNGQAILERNIFDSTFDPLAQPESSIEEGEIPDTVSGELPLVPCSDSSVKVLATVASKHATDWSFASITEGGQSKLCRVGDTVSSRTVTGITWRYLFLKGSSDECYIDIFGDGKAPPVRRPPPNSPRDGNKEDSIADGIQKVSDTERIVDRSIVDKLLADPTSFIRSVRVRPHKKNGKVVGFKLRRFRSNSPLAMLGAKKGDIIHSVNGQDLTSVDKALGAWQNLRSASDLTFSITRRGKPIDLNVRIR